MTDALIEDCYIDAQTNKYVLQLTKIKHNLNIVNTESLKYYLANDWQKTIKPLLTHIKHPFTKVSITLPSSTSTPRVPRLDEMKQRLEFRTNMNRICGQKGVYLSQSGDINELKDILISAKPFVSLSEIKETKNNGFVVGTITKSSQIKECRGVHKYSKQIRMRDCSLSADSYDFEVMLFDNCLDHFPICCVDDIIKFEYIKIKLRSAHVPFFQGIVTLDNNSAIFAVIDRGKGVIKHSNNKEYALDHDMDMFFVKYLPKLSMNNNHQRPIRNNDNNNQPSVAITNNNNNNQPNEEKASYLNFSEIARDFERLNILVLITEKLYIATNDMFYLVIWDGTTCENNDLFEFYDEKKEKKYLLRPDLRADPVIINPKLNIEMIKELLCIKYKTTMTRFSYKDAANIGSKVKLYVFQDDFQRACCEDELYVGEWTYFMNVLLDQDKKQLLFDEKTKVLKQSMLSQELNSVKRHKLDELYYKLYKKQCIVGSVSMINPHHQFQSYSVIKSILRIKVSNCKFRIICKVLSYHPSDINKFIQYENGKHLFRFGLKVMDSSGATLYAMFFGKNAHLFCGIEQPITNEADVLREVMCCMDNVMRDSHLLDLCIETYIKKKRLLYKVFDTVLIK